jgi:hypothetical protein
MANTEIINAQKQHDALNNEVYGVLSALGISDKALEQVLRVVKAETPPSKTVPKSVKVPTATAELARENGILTCTINYVNPLGVDVLFKRNVATRTADLLVKPKRSSYSTITISPALQKSGSVSVTIWATVDNKQTQIFFQTFNLLEVV